MRRFGLIGYPLSHSFSQAFFTNKFNQEFISDAEYLNFVLSDINTFPALIKSQPNLQGLNVTIPYKEDIIAFLDELDEAAKIIGAVNTIKIAPGKLVGYNTDYIGFLQSIKPFLKAHHKKALVFGTGGASKAVLYALGLLNIDYCLVSRNPEENQLSYTDIEEALLNDYTIIINTTPLGMYPSLDVCPNLPYHYISSKHLLFDLIYNPKETLFLQHGKAQGATTKNGQEMLEIQANEAWKIWLG